MQLDRYGDATTSWTGYPERSRSEQADHLRSGGPHAVAPQVPRRTADEAPPTPQGIDYPLTESSLALQVVSSRSRPAQNAMSGAAASRPRRNPSMLSWNHERASSCRSGWVSSSPSHGRRFVKQVGVSSPFTSIRFESALLCTIKAASYEPRGGTGQRLGQTAGSRRLKPGEMRVQALPVTTLDGEAAAVPCSSVLLPGAAHRTTDD